MIAILLVVVVFFIAALLYRIEELRRERDKLLDRLLVANQIMPLAPPAPVKPQRETPPPQRMKFKVFP